MLLAALLVIIMPSMKASALVLAPSNYSSNLIDDSVFTNSKSLSANQIQTFLTNMGSGLANAKDIENCGSTSGAHYVYYQQFYTCGTKQVAAQIIYDAAQAYGINPQVILSTLQKEQSLITTPNPTSSQLNYAMGYGCPDSGGCSFAGFFNQVDNGAWQFRTDLELGNGHNWWGYTPSSYPCNSSTRYYSAALKPGYSITFYDDSHVAYTTLSLNSMSTAALYCYTPHVYNNPNALYGLPRFGTAGQYYSGSYNFVYYFTLWFGSTVGELVRTNTSNQIYLLNTDNNYKYPVNDMNTYADYSILGLKYVDASYLSQFTTGHALSNFAQGQNGTLYLINAGIKLAFSNCLADVVEYGLTCDSSKYVPLTTGQFNKLVAGPSVTRLVKSNTSASVFLMNRGKKRPISSFSDASYNNIPTTVNVLSSSFVNKYITGSPLFKPGKLIKNTNSNTVYVVKDPNNLMPISSFSYPVESGLSTTNIVQISSTDFAYDYNSATSSTSFTNKLLCNSKNYVAIGGLQYEVTTDMMTNFNFSNGDFKDVGNICKVVKFSSQPLTQYIRTSNGSIYYVSGGQKHAFTSYAKYQSSSYCNNSCTYINVSTFFANSLPTGTNI